MTKTRPGSGDRCRGYWWLSGDRRGFGFLGGDSYLTTCTTLRARVGQLVEGAEHLAVAGPVGEVVPCVEVADRNAAINDYDGRDSHAFLVVPQIAAFGEVASSIAQERKGETELLDHRHVVGWWVHAYTHDPRPALLELFVLPGVAGQLPVAVRSPVASVEDEDHRSLPELLE